MSFLTKFFIILHVVLTMLVVAGLVVFVNRVEAFRVDMATLKNDNQKLQRRADTAEMEALAARSDMKAVREQSAAAVRSSKEQYDNAQTQIRDKDARNATGEQNLASANARLQAATSALKTAQETVKTLQDQLNQTRTASDKTQTQNTELLAANSDLNSKLQTALRQLRNANEDLEQAKTDLATAQDAPGGPRGAAVPSSGDVAVTGPQPSSSTDNPINGVINDQKTVNGVNYATISVGSKDNVTAGMVFRVIERGPDGDWLGYIKIDKVEPNESSGILEGPHVDRMKPGNEVRTQL